MTSESSNNQQNGIPEIGGIHLPSIPNGAHFQFVKTVKDQAAANEKLMTNTFGKAAVDALVAALEEEDRCLQLSQKSLITDDIKAADTERDRLFSGYRAAVKGFLRIPVENMAQAARVLLQHLKDYGISPQMQLERETGLVTNLVADCEQKYAAEVALLGLAPYVTALKTANLRVEELLNSRTDERAAQAAGAMRSARTTSDEAYRLLARTVNALATLGQADDLKPFIDFMNALIKRYKEQVIQTSHGTTSPGTSQGGEPEAPLPPSPAGEGGHTGGGQL
ncbi:MAG: DUF6261 family protein [Prevotella sp.]|nr:DUF6261 family protein [Prevotella sp.]MDY4038216.1 DUF6261 family protein [Prevotella sp.]